MHDGYCNYGIPALRREGSRLSRPPRLAISYSLTPKMVFRASDGVFSDTFGVSAQTQRGTVGSWPFAFAQEVSGLNLPTPTAFILNSIPGPPVASSTPSGLSEGVNLTSPPRELATRGVGYH
jgi:hypothetical protein